MYTCLICNVIMFCFLTQAFFTIYSCEYMNKHHINKIGFVFTTSQGTGAVWVYMVAIV